MLLEQELIIDKNCIYIYIQLYTYAHIYVCIDMYIYICVYMCVYIYMCIYFVVAPSETTQVLPSIAPAVIRGLKVWWLRWKHHGDLSDPEWHQRHTGGGFCHQPRAHDLHWRHQLGSVPDDAICE